MATHISVSKGNRLSSKAEPAFEHRTNGPEHCPLKTEVHTHSWGTQGPPVASGLASTARVWSLALAKWPLCAGSKQWWAVSARPVTSPPYTSAPVTSEGGGQQAGGKGEREAATRTVCLCPTVESLDTVPMGKETPSL